jgi:hypothetical protein
VAYVIALGLLANSIMRFYRFLAGKKIIFGSSKIKNGPSVQVGRQILYTSKIYKLSILAVQIPNLRPEVLEEQQNNKKIVAKN